MVSASLLDWSDIEDEVSGGGLLLGNGASLAIWPQFRYKSLFEMAQSEELSDPLTQVDQKVFSSLGTENFEEVLSALATSMMINKAVGLQIGPVKGTYLSIQSSLVQAVAKVHIEHAQVRNEVLDAIRSELRNYDYVFSTNYDLLVYWSMAREFEGFVDYFWNQGGYFFTDNVEVRDDDCTKVLWLHGGLHLLTDPDGWTLKRRKSMFTLLEKFRTDYKDGSVPLFVSEGDSKEKLAAIRRSEYLEFAYETFASHDESLVVFGHNLGKQDRHLVEKMRGWEEASIAIAIRTTPRTSSTSIMQRKLRFMKLLPDADISFFEAATHPLGDPNLRCP